MEIQIDQELNVMLNTIQIRSVARVLTTPLFTAAEKCGCIRSITGDQVYTLEAAMEVLERYAEKVYCTVPVVPVDEAA